jgi:outer membrane protein TolC
MKQKLIIIITFYLLSTGQSTVQSQERMSLKSCLETALKQNFDVRISRNDQQISNNNLSPGNAGMLPKIDLQTGLSGSLADETLTPANGAAVTNKGILDDRYSAGVQLNWTIFDGFSMFTAWEKLKEMQAQGELNTRLTIENLISDITAEYFSYIHQQIRYENLKYAVKLSAERLRIVDARYQIGSMSGLELQQAKVDFNADSSKLFKQKEILYASRIRMNELMAENQTEKSFIPEDSIIIFNAIPDKNTQLEQMQQNNIFLMMARKEMTLSVLELKAAQSKNLPWVKLNAGYGYALNRYEAATYPRQQNMGVSYGLSLGYNLFDGFNRKREQQNARISIENKELALKQLEMSLRSDFSNIRMAWQNNRELTMLEQQNLGHARKNYEIAMERYRLGNLSGIELREAQNSLLEAEDRLVQAQYNTKMCEISLLQLCGGIMQYVR